MKEGAVRILAAFGVQYNMSRIQGGYSVFKKSERRRGVQGIVSLRFTMASSRLITIAVTDRISGRRVRIQNARLQATLNGQKHSFVT
mmetsp:Transcript_11113/g.32149  ORF Transcript_11113/g.32149 Transcript_11113/m.32149 type:complete len:87 (+) Transcript_11113:1369-1629(+)